jgi:hypothetical protein
MAEQPSKISAVPHHDNAATRSLNWPRPAAQPTPTRACSAPLKSVTRAKPRLAAASMNALSEGVSSSGGGCPSRRDSVECALNGGQQVAN